MLRGLRCHLEGTRTTTRLSALLSSMLLLFSKCAFIRSSISERIQLGKMVQRPERAVRMLRALDATNVAGERYAE